MFVHKKLPLVIGVLVLVIAVLVAVFYFGSKDRSDDFEEFPEVEDVEVSVEDTVVPEEVPALENESEEEIVIDDPEGEQIKQIARVFVELWGSYSLDNDFENFDDAAHFGTLEVFDYLNGLKLELQSDNDKPHQIVSSAMSAKFVERDVSYAELEVLAVRVERNDGVEREYRQRAFIEMTEFESGWLVSRATWSDKTF